MGHGCLTENILGMDKVRHDVFLGTAGKWVSKHYNHKLFSNVCRFRGISAPLSCKKKKKKRLKSNGIVAFDVNTFEVSCVNGALATLLPPPPHLYEES